MTTIIRKGDYIYSDSRYGSYYGGFAIAEKGPSKLFISDNKDAVIGMAGEYSATIPFDLIKNMVAHAIVELQKYPNSNMRIADELSEYYRMKREATKENDDTDNHTYQLLICTLKGSFVFNCINDNTGDSYNNSHASIAIGSGSAYYVPFRNIDMPIEDLFKIIYTSDNCSGGAVNAFDLKQLMVTS